MADWQGNIYNYVVKENTKEPKELIQTIITFTQDYLRREGITFEFQLIGSASRNFVTQVVNEPDSDFDFDYNFIVQKDGNCSANQIKGKFLDALQLAINDFNRRNDKNREITEPKISKNVLQFKTKIQWFSCDIAILRIAGYDANGNPIYELLVQTSQGYVWNSRNYYIDFYHYNLLIENNLVNELRVEYLKVKNNNQDENKKSFSLFVEAVDNVYNRYNWR